MRGGAADTVPQEGFTTLEAPSVMRTARQDQFDQAELSTAYPRVSCATSEGGKRNVHFGRPDESDELIGDWLDRIELLLGLNCCSD